MKSLPTLRQLHYLVAVTEHCHFGRAAEASFVTQSTLSAAIQELEQILGIILFERSQRRVVPTPAGLALVAKARHILQETNELTQMARAAQNPLQGPLQLGLIPTIAPYLLPRIMTSLHQQFPQLKPYLREGQTEELLKTLRSGQLDAAIIALPYPTEELAVKAFAQDHFWLVCHKDHPLAVQKFIFTHELATEDILLLEAGHCLRQQAISACALEGAKRNQNFQGTSLHTLVQMVAVRMGITLLPELALPTELSNQPSLTALPFSKQDRPARALALVWRPSTPRPEIFQKLGEFLENIFKKPPLN